MIRHGIEAPTFFFAFKLSKSFFSFHVFIIWCKKLYDGTKTTMPPGTTLERFKSTCPRSEICRDKVSDRVRCHGGRVEQTTAGSLMFANLNVKSPPRGLFDSVIVCKLAVGMMCPQEKVEMRSRGTWRKRLLTRSDIFQHSYQYRDTADTFVLETNR